MTLRPQYAMRSVKHPHLSWSVVARVALLLLVGIITAMHVIDRHM